MYIAHLYASDSRLSRVKNKQKQNKNKTKALIITSIINTKMLINTIFFK